MIDLGLRLSVHSRSSLVVAAKEREKAGDHHHIAKLFPPREPSSYGPSESSSSSPRPVIPDRADLPPDLTEKELVRFTDDVNREAALRSGADDQPSSDNQPQQQQQQQQQQQSPPPQYPASETSASSSPSRPPPPFSSLFTDAPPLDQSAAALAVLEPCEPYKASVSDADTLAAFGESSSAAPAYAPASDLPPVVPGSSNAARFLQDETKRALPQDTKAGSSRKEDEAEPPPAYSEGSSPLQSFTYLMAAAGGAASIITQVQQGGPPGGINTIGGEIYCLSRESGCVTVVRSTTNGIWQMSAPMRRLPWTCGRILRTNILHRYEHSANVYTTTKGAPASPSRETSS